MDRASGIGLTPWEADPYKLISWWDMEEFSAAQFYNIANLFEAFMTDLREEQRSRQNFYDSDGFDEETILRFESRFLFPIEEQCRKIALRHSMETIIQFRNDIHNLSLEKIRARIEAADRAIRIDLKLHLFMYLPIERAEYYQSFGEEKRREQGKEIPLFGDAVLEKFRSTDYDVTEAGNCFAVARFSGCVFHLMKILEVGLTVFAKKFNVPSDIANWHIIIKAIEKKINGMGDDPNKSANWKDEQEFYSQTASYLMVVKNAWRNYTMHYRPTKYTEEEAEIMIKSVRMFMQRLSERLSEESEG